MSFMKPEITGKQTWIEIDGGNGLTLLPADVAPEILAIIADEAAWAEDEDGQMEALKDAAGTYYDLGPEHIERVETVEGFGARLSAPGYLDCTEWSVYDTETAAMQSIVDETDGEWEIVDGALVEAEDESSEFEVIVGNIGTVYTGTSEADAKFEIYKDQSATGYGRASGEDVTMMKDGEVYREFTGSNSESPEETDEDDLPDYELDENGICNEFQGHLKPWGVCHNCRKDYSLHAEFKGSDTEKEYRG